MRMSLKVGPKCSIITAYHFIAFTLRIVEHSFEIQIKGGVVIYCYKTFRM